MINDYEATVPITTDAVAIGEYSDNEEVISTLNNLIETCKDGQEGFEHALEGIDRTDLQSFFRDCSLQRRQFAEELQTLVQSLGGDPANSGSIAGSLHRGWINIKSVVTGQDEAAILNECERGEDIAKKAYEDALETFLPDYIRETVQTQYTGIVAAHDQVKMYRDAANNRSSSATSSN